MTALYPSLYGDGLNANPPEVQAQHQREAYWRLHAHLVWAVNHIAKLELGSDYVTIPADWDDETVKRYDSARHAASPNPTTKLHR